MDKETVKKKFGKWRTGGLQAKILKLCIVLVIGAITVFAIVGILQLRSLSKMSTEIGDAQTKTIKEISGDTFMKTTQQSMSIITAETAHIVDRQFWSFEHDFTALAEQVEDVFRHPEHYEGVDISPPRKENAGKYSLQYIYPDRADPNDGRTLSILRRLAVLEPMMKAIVEGDDDYYLDCYISLPSGHIYAAR